MKKILFLAFFALISMATVSAQATTGKPATDKTAKPATGKASKSTTGKSAKPATDKAAKPAAATTAKPAVQLTFDTEMIKLGKVKKGEKRKFDFVFTNTGKDAIKIDQVSGCDCTTLEWTRKQILPGQKGIINVIFDSTEKTESEVIDVDIYLDNLDPKTGNSILKIVKYDYELTK